MYIIFIFRIFLFSFLHLIFAQLIIQKITLTKHCGLPSNINDLPDFAQDEIQSVWKDYIPGNKCEKEIQITEDILAVLITFEKELKNEKIKEEEEEQKTTKIFNKQTKQKILNFTKKQKNNILRQENEKIIKENNEYLTFSKKRKNPVNIYENEENENYNIGKNEYENEKEEIIEENNDEQQEYFKIKDLPFLRGSSPDIVDLFRKVINDPEFPTEKKRLEEIQLLAVSYLNEHQLAKFDIWATKRRNHDLKNIENKSEDE